MYVLSLSLPPKQILLASSLVLDLPVLTAYAVVLKGFLRGCRSQKEETQQPGRCHRHGKAPPLLAALVSCL